MSLGTHSHTLAAQGADDRSSRSPSIYFLVSARKVYPQAENGELTGRKSMPARVFFKARDKLTIASVDFDGSGDLYRVEWCGADQRIPTGI
jgi:hypothetical protein